MVRPVTSGTSCQRPSAADATAASSISAAAQPSATDGASCSPVSTDSMNCAASTVFMSSKPMEVPAPGWKMLNDGKSGPAITRV